MSHYRLMKLGSAVLAIIISACSDSYVETKTAALAVAGQKPNIIYMLADDMGYGDVGAYGQTKIRTPNIDRLATEGVRFTQHYSGNTVCAPSRASLLTGKHPGHAQIRGNQNMSGAYDFNQEMGQVPLKPGTETIASMLKHAGYKTAIIGKWGLGGPLNNVGPNDFGFDYFHGYLDQLWAHNYYPTHLWENKQKVKLDNRFFSPHAKDAGTSTRGEDYKDYMGNEFAPDVMTDAALNFIEQNADQPFFLYLAFAQPHASMQVPDEYVERYADENWAEPNLEEGNNYTPHPKPRAARAGLVSTMDDDIGEVMALLDKLGLSDNTLVVFSSDNGPTFEGGQDIDFFASSGGLRGGKRELYEGGVRVPMIAKWPGKIPQNTSTDMISAFWDIASTFADAANTPTLEETDGISLLPYMVEPSKAGPQDRPLYWEFPLKRKAYQGVQAVRIGKWKGVRFNGMADPQAPIELYDLDQDPRETTNIAAQHPEIIQRIGQVMQQRSPAMLTEWDFLSQ